MGDVREKRCSRCAETKAADQFYGGNKKAPDGLQAYCKPCCREVAREYRQRPGQRDEILRQRREHYRLNRERLIAEGRAYREANPEKVAEIQRNSIIKRKYGLTPADYDALVTAQAGRCLICCATPDRLHIDHDHETGQVRGLLCGQCNTAIGLLKDSPLNLQRAIHYLLRPSVTTPMLGQEMEA